MISFSLTRAVLCRDFQYWPLVATYVQIIAIEGPGEMAQKVKNSLHKHKDSNPQTPPQKTGAVVLVCNSNVGEAETGELLMLVGRPAPAELVSSKFSEGPC